MRLYNLRLTPNQAYLIDSNIFDLCNFSLKHKYTQSELSRMDISDANRISLYSKYSKEDRYYILRGLTLAEIQYVKQELEYHCIYINRNGREKYIALNVLGNIKDLLDIKLQKDRKFKKLRIT